MQYESFGDMMVSSDISLTYALQLLTHRLPGAQYVTNNCYLHNSMLLKNQLLDLLTCVSVVSSSSCVMSIITMDMCRQQAKCHCPWV